MNERRREIVRKLRALLPPTPTARLLRWLGSEKGAEGDSSAASLGKNPLGTLLKSPAARELGC